MTSPKTMHSIQVLRAVAAMLVVLFHAQLAFAGAGARPACENQAYLFSFGAVGVHIFFVISGFIMVYTTRIDEGYDARAFWRRRLMRIFPIYWICAALYLALHGLIGEPYRLTGADMIKALLLVPGKAPDIIGPAWTLSFELYFYLVFGLFMLAGLTRGLLALTGFFVLSIIARQLAGYNQSALNLASNPLLLEFIAGCAIGWLVKRGRLPARGGWIILFAALAIYAGGMAAGVQRIPTVIGWGVPSALLILGLVILETRYGAPMLIRRIGYLGDSSYALYLIHILVITLSLLASRELVRIATLEPALVAIAIGVLAQIVAELLHRKVERPLLRRINPRRALVPPRPELLPGA